MFQAGILFPQTYNEKPPEAAPLVKIQGVNESITTQLLPAAQTTNQTEEAEDGENSPMLIGTDGLSLKGGPFQLVPTMTDFQTRAEAPHHQAQMPQNDIKSFGSGEDGVVRNGASSIMSNKNNNQADHKQEKSQDESKETSSAERSPSRPDGNKSPLSTKLNLESVIAAQLR